MRTIKFKGKRLDNGEWLEGYYRGDNEGKAFISRIKRPPLSFEVAPATVCQFIGFLDKTARRFTRVTCCVRTNIRSVVPKTTSMTIITAR